MEERRGGTERGWLMIADGRQAGRGCRVVVVTFRVVRYGWGDELRAARPTLPIYPISEHFHRSGPQGRRGGLRRLAGRRVAGDRAHGAGTPDGRASNRGW